MPANRQDSIGDASGATRWFFSAPGSATARAVAFEGRLGRAYNQDAFWNLLAIERARAERSGCSLLAVLISTTTEAGETIPFAPRMAARVFNALWLCIRDVDLTGWYTQGRVAGALLVQDRIVPQAEEILRIRTRINQALPRRVPAGAAGGWRVRVLQLGAARRDDGRLPAPQRLPVTATTAVSRQ